SSASLALPKSRRDPVDHDEAHARRALVASTTVPRDQLTHSRWDELVALAEPHDVDVVLRQQPDLAGGRFERIVAGEDEGAATFDADLGQLGCQAVEQHPGVRHLERGGGEPLAEVGRASRAVGVQETAADLPQRLVLVGSLTPVLDPLVGPGESDPRPLRRPLAKLAEEEGEPTAQPLAGSASDALHDLLCQLVPEEAAAVQHVPDSRPNRFDLVGADSWVEHTCGISPGRQSLFDRAHDRAAGREPERKLAR